MSFTHDEVQKFLKLLGFKGFTVRQYDKEMYSFLSVAVEDNAKAYLIDVVPSSLENGRNDGIALMEKHYYKPANMEQLCKKWLEIILLFSCYYPLECIFVTGLALEEDELETEEALSEAPTSEEPTNEESFDDDGYYLEVPMESIADLDSFADMVFQKTYGVMTFWFASLDMVFHYEPSDVYMIVTLKKITEENTAAIDLLRKLVEAQGLFLL